MLAQTVSDQVAVLDPDLVQRAVPGLGRLGVVLDIADPGLHGLIFA